MKTGWKDANVEWEGIISRDTETLQFYVSPLSEERAVKWRKKKEAEWFS